ncbi:ATP-binding cassette domain-containing protein [Listeria booriae]|uniref:ATP-binding cassette domain-containing protein n=1 Tax=Listeria booriae TaxID=1552123 RepID=A0A7X1A3Z1_9LIST|nr:ATP-binding cassette domain-containing protein [Listeria booriae]MBC2370848.1 ATP-binding cassette domain-containing protein [Listeria booriae]
MIQIINLSKNYKKQQVLKSIYLNFETPGFYFFLGKNGAGKTTFFKCLTGFEKFTGEINILNERSSDNYFGVMFSELMLYLNLSGENCIKALCINNLIDSEWQFVKNYFSDIKLEKKVKDYSLGQQKLLTLLILILNDAKVLVLDEVSNGLDYETSSSIKALLSELKKEKIILSCGHQFEFYEGIIDSLYVLNDGEINKIEEENYNLGEVYEKYIGSHKATIKLPNKS